MRITNLEPESREWTDDEKSAMQDRRLSWRRCNERCENPLLYQAEHQQTAESELHDLNCGFIRAIKPRYVLETGTHEGYHALSLCQALQINNYGELHTIEHSPGKAARASSYLAGFQCKRVELFTADARTWEPPYGVRYGFAWFDTDPKLDIVDYFPHYAPYLQVGAIVGFHDTGTGFRNYRQRIMSELHGKYLHCWHIETPRGVTYGTVLPF